MLQCFEQTQGAGERDGEQEGADLSHLSLVGVLGEFRKCFPVRDDEFHYPSQTRPFAYVTVPGRTFCVFRPETSHHLSWSFRDKRSGAEACEEENGGWEHWTSLTLDKVLKQSRWHPHFWHQTGVELWRHRSSVRCDCVFNTDQVWGVRE